MEETSFKITTYQDGNKPKEIIEEVGKLAVDIYENDSNFVILAPIAGTEKENLEIILIEDVLTIKGERKLEEKINEEDFISKECFWGKFSRSIILPREANSKKITANFKNSVLKIEIEKETELGPKQINISE